LHSIISDIYCNAEASGAVQWGLVHGANYTILWLSGDSQGAIEGLERDRACIGGMLEGFANQHASDFSARILSCKWAEF